ncbi:unnamed protein product, partial [Allacma fusca]
IIGIIT